MVLVILPLPHHTYSAYVAYIIACIAFINYISYIACIAYFVYMVYMAYNTYAVSMVYTPSIWFILPTLRIGLVNSLYGTFSITRLLEHLRRGDPQESYLMCYIPR